VRRPYTVEKQNTSRPNRHQSSQPKKFAFKSLLRCQKIRYINLYLKAKKIAHGLTGELSREIKNKNMTQKIAKRQFRFSRNPNPKNIRLTERRLDELEILHNHRLATTEIFTATMPGSDQRIRKELRELFDAGYVGRPLEQLAMHIKHKGGYGRSENIYALANRGRQALQDTRGIDVTGTDLNRKNKELGETTIFHDVQLTRMWACLKAGLDQKRKNKKDRYNLIWWLQDRQQREKLKTEITLPRSFKKVTVIPDAAFKLQCPRTQHLFLVEYYRTRKGGHQNYLNHLKLYNLYFKQKHFRKYEIKKGFKIITLVPTRQIMANLIEMINSQKQNVELRHYRFWFVAEEDYWLYKKELVSGSTYRQVADFESVLSAVFRTPADNKWHWLEE